MEKKTTPSIPLRKDVRFLRKSQRERFFYCLKFLSVLPPQQQGNFRKFNVAWKIQNGQRYYKNLSPRNIHDEFISSHQTCCEHGSIYFVYYHRHLMTCFEISLNYAEEVLVGGKNKIPASLYTPNAKYFDAVFDRYQKIINALRVQLGLSVTDNLPQISAHYWNPVDYTTHITIPEELQSRTPDAMDQLYFAVNSHYAWQFNFATRWFSTNTSQPRLPVNFESMGYFSSQDARYSDEENKVVYGTLNPRSTVQDQFFGINNIDQYGMSFISNTASEINLWKNYKKLKETGSTINVCTLDQSEIDTLFGSKAKDLHWISTKQRKLFSVDNSLRAYTYNKSLPHFQFAYALYKKSNIFIKDYVSTASINGENSMQNSHNTMHNILQLFMSDSQLSITNPLFFLYHSWIDYQLEVKIRMIRTDPNSSKTEYLYTKNFLDTRMKPFSVLDQVSGSGQTKYGDYYIFQWANPTTRFYPQIKQPLTAQDYQVAFKTRNFIINDDKSGIRRSDELTSFYKKEYLPNHGSKYAYFKNFGNFNFDYNYQIHDYDKDGNRVPIQMKDNSIAIPSYIKAIYEDYDAQWNKNKTNTINPPKLASFEQENTKQVAQRNSLQREIRILIGGYATYSSSIKSTDVPIELKATQKGLKYLQLSPEYMEIMKKGVVITTASIFSRGVGSELCPNCKDEKQYYIFGSQKIAEMSQQFFCQLSRNLVKKTYFKIKDNKEQPIQQLKLNDLLTLSTHRPVFNRLQLIQGSLQADFSVQFKGKQYPHCKVVLSLYSYCIQSNKLENIIARKKQTLDGTEFQFPRVMGVHEGKSHYHYVYRRVQGLIINGDERCDFSFDITTRNRLLTFLILVEEKFDSNNEGYLDVEIVDKHYDFKMKHFEQGSIQINE